MRIALKKLIKIDQLLAERYGRKDFVGGTDPLTELIKTILSQNTSDLNRDRAFANLKQTFPCWDDVAKAPLKKIATSIKTAGLADIRAKRIKKALLSISNHNGALTLDFLAEWSDQQIKEYLQRLDGVGPKTTACVMAFSLGRNVMPVDTHVYRVSQRLGILPPKISVQAAHELFLNYRDLVSLYRFHLNLIAHGRNICRARKPFCDKCHLKAQCNYYNESINKKGNSSHKTTNLKQKVLFKT